MHAFRWAVVALLLPRASTALECYETVCIDEEDPPCATVDATVNRRRNCAALGQDELPVPEGGGTYDRCLRTQVSGAVPYTTPGDDGISYYACGSSGGYYCDSEESSWDSSGVVIIQEHANASGASGENATVVRTSRWCCSTARCNEPTQDKIDRLAAEVAALADAYATEPTFGFEYMQAPTWSVGSCDTTAVDPIDDFTLRVGEVGECKTFNRRGVLDDILAFYIGSGPAENMAWAFMAHCVECDTMPGDGNSRFAASEGRTTAKHYFYASIDCDKLTLLYIQEYTLGRSSSSCLASPSLDGTGYIARCGEPTVGNCPKPAEGGFTIMEFADSSCQLPVHRLVAWDASRSSQCVSDFSSTKPEFIPSTVRSAIVCCTSQVATLYFYSDMGCNTTHDPNADAAELGLVFRLHTCEQRDSLNPMAHFVATCSIVQQNCPPLHEMQEGSELTAESDSMHAADFETTTVEQFDGLKMAIIIGSSALVVLSGLYITRSKWMTEDQQAKLHGILHGSVHEVNLEERPVVEKDKTEREKIMEQYRTASYKDSDKSDKGHLQSQSKPELPGATSFDDDVEDPLRAAKLATEAAIEEKQQLRQAKSFSDKPGRVRSSSHRAKSNSGEGTGEQKNSVRSQSTREHRSSHRSHSARDQKSSVRSQSTREHRSSHRSHSSGEQNSSVRSQSTRSHRHRNEGASLRSNSVLSSKDRTQRTEKLRSVSEGSRRSAMQHSLKQMKNLDEMKAQASPDKRREDSIVACRALFDRIDVDGSGTLERNEIAMLATKMGRGLKSEELDAAMTAMDKDGNGCIDFDEFYTWYRGSSKSMGKAEVKVLAYLKRSTSTDTYR